MSEIFQYEPPTSVVPRGYGGLNFLASRREGYGFVWAYEGEDTPAVRAEFQAYIDSPEAQEQAKMREEMNR